MYANLYPEYIYVGDKEWQLWIEAWSTPLYSFIAHALSNMYLMIRF